MARWFNRQSHKAGLPPGTLIPMEGQKAGESGISITEYDSREYRFDDRAELERSLECRDGGMTSWISVHGLDPEIIKTLGGHFDLHPLTLEDIQNTDHRPKFEEFENYLFITLKMIRLDTNNGGPADEQVSLVIGHGYVISFQESGTGLFATVRERLERSAGRIRHRGSDYLCYALLDRVIDNYYVILEDKDRIIEDLERAVFDRPDDDIVERVFNQRREAILLRRSIWPLKDLIQSFENSPSELIAPATRTFLRDILDHVLSVKDTVDIFLEMLTSIHDNHRLVVGERLNQTMKVLTIIATIFIPLTFVAGIYGMNFEVMPELKIRWAYPAVLGLMITMAGGMVLYFKKKNWL